MTTTKDKHGIEPPADKHNVRLSIRLEPLSDIRSCDLVDSLSEVNRITRRAVGLAFCGVRLSKNVLELVYRMPRDFQPCTIEFLKGLLTGAIEANGFRTV